MSDNENDNDNALSTLVAARRMWRDTQQAPTLASLALLAPDADAETLATIHFVALTVWCWEHSQGAQDVLKDCAAKLKKEHQQQDIVDLLNDFAEAEKRTVTLRTTRDAAALMVDEWRLMGIKVKQQTACDADGVLLVLTDNDARDLLNMGMLFNESAAARAAASGTAATASGTAAASDTAAASGAAAGY
jgi:hypothetical protein